MRGRRPPSVRLRRRGADRATPLPGRQGAFRRRGDGLRCGQHRIRKSAARPGWGPDGPLSRRGHRLRSAVRNRSGPGQQRARSGLQPDLLRRLPPPRRPRPFRVRRDLPVHRLRTDAGQPAGSRLRASRGTGAGPRVRPADRGPGGLRGAPGGAGGDELVRGGRPLRRRRDLYPPASHLRTDRHLHRPSGRGSHFGAHGAPRVRPRSPRGGRRVGDPRASPTRGTPTGTASPEGPTTSSTSKPGARCSGASAGRRTTPPCCSRWPRPTGRTSASPPPISPGSPRPASRRPTAWRTIPSSPRRFSTTPSSTSSPLPFRRGGTSMTPSR